jgi:hypothetical protein
MQLYGFDAIGELKKRKKSNMPAIDAWQDKMERDMSAWDAA